LPIISVKSGINEPYSHARHAYIPIHPAVKSSSAPELPGYTPNVKPRTEEGARITSTAFLFFEFAAEALTYEVGDTTPREFIRRKAEVTAEKLMELMLERAP